MTNYVVFVKTGDNTWRQFTAIHARSARSAIQKALEGADNPYEDGEFVATPTRSWKPVSVKTETKTQLKFS